MLQVVTLVVGGSMALNGQVNPEQLTTFVLYVEFVTAASLSVCDQWGPLMEAVGASERVMYYLDKPAAPQIAAGRKLPSWSGKVPSHLPSPSAVCIIYAWWAMSSVIVACSGFWTLLLHKDIRVGSLQQSLYPHNP